MAEKQCYENFVIHQADDAGCLPDCGQRFTLRKQLSRSNFCGLLLHSSSLKNYYPLVQTVIGQDPFHRTGTGHPILLVTAQNTALYTSEESLNYGVIEQPGKKRQALSVNQSIQLHSLSYISFHSVGPSKANANRLRELQMFWNTAD